MQTRHDRISVGRIKKAANIIDCVFLNTPQYPCESLSEVLQTRIILKVETQNPIRSFKGRGTELLISNLEDQSQVVCASAGNFGQAMAYSCRKKRIKLTVFASTKANCLKIERMRSLGAEVVLVGNDFDEAKVAAKSFSQQTGIRFIEDSVDIETVEGAGTIGLELLNLREKLDYVLIALGNGALLNGVAKVFKESDQHARIVAIQATGAPAMIESWKKGEVISHRTVNTIADGIAVRLPIPQALTDMKGLVDEGLLIEDGSIVEGMKMLRQHAGLIVEPSAAVGIAAILDNRAAFKNKTVATIICGGNLTEEQINKWF